MRLSTSDNLIQHEGYTLSYIQRIDRMYKAGFRVFDLNLTDYQHDGSPFRSDYWLEWAREIKDHAEKTGITFSQAHAPVYPFHDENKYDESMDDMMHRSFIVCNMLNIPWLVVHTQRPLGWSLEQTRSINTSYVNKLLKWAHEYGVGIAVENLPNEPGRDDEAKHFILTPRSLLEYVNSFHDELLAICIDVGHALLMGWNIPEAIEIVSGKLRALHIQDNDGVRDQHLPPYFGIINWAEVISSLKRNNYSGDFTYEICFPMRRAPKNLQDELYRLIVHVGEYLISL